MDSEFKGEATKVERKKSSDHLAPLVPERLHLVCEEAARRWWLSSGEVRE